MNTFFSLISILNIDYLFNSNLKREFVIFKCVINIILAIMEILKVKEYRWIYVILIILVQFAHERYDKNASDSPIYYLDPLYLISGDGVKKWLGSLSKFILYLIVTIFTFLYYISNIQQVKHFYCYGDKPISQYFHGVCPPKTLNQENFVEDNAICDVENCLLPINIHSQVVTFFTYSFFLTLPQWGQLLLRLYRGSPQK